ncbi:MAG: molybdenum cofactor biosynthesis protein MoaE [Pseudomonadota bacterium]
MITVAVTAEPLDLNVWLAQLPQTEGTGAVATFAGYCRGEAGRLAALELEHYPGMAEGEMKRIATEAMARWPIHGVVAVHRCGLVTVGAPIVLVATSSAHRDAAFDATRYVMDFLKTDAPFWKREHHADGTVGAWIEANAKDDAARARWAP